MNPYYNPDALGLDMLSFDQDNLSYEFNILCFWATPDGQIYSASDSGCSCPTPFENYEGETLEEVLEKMERVGSVEQAEDMFDFWNNPYPSASERTDKSGKREVAVWVKNKLKK